MPLSKGHRLGNFEILAVIGAGGMGEVYRARDIRLDRIVALKVSKSNFSERFEREARAISALNHPHICQLYDVGPNYLVMEYIEGAQLKGPLPLDKALEYAGQIASALDEAHSKKITHRDLKPANIMVTKSSGVKLLDFGLAKVQTSVAVDDETLSMGLTVKGQILGTLLYMSPEQVQGQETDTRSDIFSFGLVLYEMLTGKRAFEGSTPASVMGAILERPAPSITEIAPSGLDYVLKKCLEKEPEDRWQTARDLKAALELSSRSVATATEFQQPASSSRIGWAVAAIAVLAALGLGFVHFRESVPAVPQFRYTLPAPDKALVEGFAISPDGSHEAMVLPPEDRPRQLYLRALDSLQTQALAGTEYALYPFWSPDGGSIGFFADGKLKRVSVTGGAVQTLCDVSEGRGGAWNQDNVILFGSSGLSLRRVPAAGGTPVAMGKDQGDQRFPAFLPDGDRYLYTSTGNGTQTGVHVASLSGSIDSQSPLLAADISNASYAPPIESRRPGHVLFVRQGTLMALPVDPKTLAASGDAFPVAEEIADSGNTAAFRFSTSQNGIMTYQAGTAATSELTWFDRQGKNLGAVGERGPYSVIQLSPDSTRAAVIQAGDLWVVDLARGTKTRLTSDRTVDRIIWSPDGAKLAYGSTRGGAGAFGIYTADANGVGASELVYKTGSRVGITHWSPDGRFLAYNYSTNNIWALPLTGEAPRKQFPLVVRGFQSNAARFSPDSRFIAYRSNDTGKNEIYVEVFDAASKGDGKSAVGGRWIVSKGSSGMPRWRQDGKELYFISLDGRMMAAPISESPVFRAGEPVALFSLPPQLARNANPGVLADASADGNRFLFVLPATGVRREEVTVVLNWQAGLKN